LARRLGDGTRLARAAFGLGTEFTTGSVDDLEVSLLEETLAVLGESDSTLRARMLARLAKALQSSPHSEQRTQLGQAAVAMARRLGDPATLAAVLYEHHMATWGRRTWRNGRHHEAHEQVERLAADDFASLPRNHLYLYHLAAMAIACHALDDEPRAARLYPLLQPYADRNVLVARLPLGTLGSASHYLGCWPRPCDAGTTRSPTFRSPWPPTTACVPPPLLERSRLYHVRLLHSKSSDPTGDTPQ
jgi:hypothetical protein